MSLHNAYTSNYYTFSLETCNKMHFICFTAGCKFSVEFYLTHIFIYRLLFQTGVSGFNRNIVVTMYRIHIFIMTHNVGFGFWMGICYIICLIRFASFSHNERKHKEAILFSIRWNLDNYDISFPQYIFVESQYIHSSFHSNMQCFNSF